MVNGTIRKRAPGALTLLVLAAVSVFSQNTLILDVDQAQDTIKKTIYGGLMEDWFRDIYGGIYVGVNSSVPNTNGMRNDIIDGLKEMDIGVLQFPGGCKAEEYHWADGVDGTKAEREARNNGLGTDEYFQLCELVGCAPFIQACCKDGSPAEMKAWLNYIHEHFPDKLRYLGMGNEPWGGCWAQFGNDGVTKYLDQWYDPFKAAIPEVFAGKIIRVAAAGFTDQGTTISAWTEEVMRREVGSIEGLSWHYYTTKSWDDAQRYPSTGFGEDDYYGLLTLAFAMETQAKKVMTSMDKYDPDITCGLQPDEWGAWNQTYGNFGGTFQQMTVREAQLTAQHLNFFNNNCRRIWMAQAAQPVNAIHSFFLTQSTHGPMVKTPAFYVYKLYVPHHNALMVPSRVTCGKVGNLNTLTASTSVNSENVLHISISNIHATALQELAITINGGTYDSISGRIVNGPAINSFNDFNKEEEVNIKDFASSNFSLDGNKVNVTMPAHSVVMLALKPPVTGTTNMKNATVFHRFAVAPLPGNRISIQHGFSKATPVSLALYTIDGKLAAPVVTMVTGGAAIRWSPEVQRTGSNAYIVTLSACGVSMSKQVVLQSGN
ncbi:MAG: hypothetical protein JW863_14105 [Chitinispirillaceae bacterium]|nr:hypothetical protein [Chitinispirillaceae bacterium]